MKKKILTITATVANKNFASRPFSCSYAFNMDSDLMSRISAMLNKNKSLNKEFKHGILSKEKQTVNKLRESLDERLLQEHKKAQDYIKNALADATAEDITILNEKRSLTNNIIQQYKLKIECLDRNDPQYDKNIAILRHLSMKSMDKHLDETTENLEKSMLKACLDTAGPDTAMWLKRGMTSRRLERAKILQEDKELFIKEKELFGKIAEIEKNSSADADASADREKNSSADFPAKTGKNTDNNTDNKTEKSSLIDDFANPNLEQPSYMDPED